MDVNGIEKQNRSKQSAIDNGNMQKLTGDFELDKTLSMYDASDINIDNTAKIAELREKIANGTYVIDAKLTAQSIMRAIKEGKNIK